MKFVSEVFQIRLSITTNTLNAIVKFFSSVQLDIFAKFPDIAVDVFFFFFLRALNY